MDKACTGKAFADRTYAGGVYINRACIDRACRDGAYIGKACDIIYSKSPTSLGNGGFVYIKGSTKILLSLQEAKNLLVLI